MVGKDFNNFHVCYTTQEISTSLYQLEEGIAVGCSIYPIPFTVAFEIILIGGRQMVSSYMDDVTTLLQMVACSSRLLNRLEELLS